MPNKMNLRTQEYATSHAIEKLLLKNKDKINKRWQGYGDIGILVHCWWEGKNGAVILENSVDGDGHGYACVTMCI